MSSILNRLFARTVDVIIADLKKIADKLAVHARLHAAKTAALRDAADVAEAEAKRAEAVAAKLNALIS